MATRVLRPSKRAFLCIPPECLTACKIWRGVENFHCPRCLTVLQRLVLKWLQILLSEITSPCHPWRFPFFSSILSIIRSRLFVRSFLFIYLFILSRVITRFYEYRATLCARCYFNLSPSMCFLNKFNFGFFVWIVVTFTSYDDTSFACLNCKALGFENLRLVGYGASENITAQVKNGYFLTYLLSQTALILHKPITWSLNP